MFGIKARKYSEIIADRKARKPAKPARDTRHDDDFSYERAAESAAAAMDRRMAEDAFTAATRFAR